MMKSRILSRAALAAALVFLLSGCGGGPKVYPVEGVVLLDGAPLEGASIIFTPEGPGQPAVSVTDADGSFKLDTQAGTGAQAGAYRVTLQKVFGTPIPWPPPGTGKGGLFTEADSKAYQRQVAEIKKAWKNPIPKAYRANDTTPLRFTVPLKEKLRLELSNSATPAGDGN